jgi:hypothetical protein
MAIDPKDLETQRELNELHRQESALLREKTKAQQEYDIAVQQGGLNQKELAERLMEVSARHDEVAEKLDNLKYRTDEAATATSNLKGALVGIGSMLPGVISSFDQFNGTQFASLTNFNTLFPAVGKFVTVLRDTQVELRRTTGFQDRYSRAFTRLRGSYQGLNLPQAELEKNLIALNQNFSAFDAMSPAMRDNLTMLAGNFTLLGVSGEETGKMLDDLHFAFGIVGDAAVEAGGDLRELSKETGLGMSVLLRDLNELSPELARFGMEGTRVFAGMAKQARSLGLSTKDIFDVSEQLDTFQGAADIVGRMNAQFGMQLNSVELMKASHEERVDILRQEFRLQGRSFQALDRRQKQMLASILGRDVKTVAKLFGDQMDITAFQEDVGKVDPLEKFTKQSDRIATMQEQAFDKVVEVMGGFDRVNQLQTNLLIAAQNNMGSVVQGLLALASISFATGAAGKFKDVFKGAPKMNPGSMADDVIKAAPKMKPTGLFDQFGKPIMKEVGKEATEVAAKATGSVVKNVAKTGLKAGLKALPVVGLGLGVYDAIGRLSRGDYVGAGLDIIAGGAAMVPGLGTGASLAISGTAIGANLAKDYMAASDPAKAVPNMESTMAKVESMNTASASSGDTIQLNIQELVVKSSVEVDGDVLGQKTQKYFNTALNPTMAN